MNFNKILINISDFKKDAHRILSAHETSPSRIVNPENTFNQLSGLSINQEDLFKQSMRCIESKLYRAAHVMSRAAFMDFLESLLDSDGMQKLKSIKTNWSYSTIEELRENIPDFQIIEAARNVGLCTKNQVKALHGLLNKPNECAHPSEYYPDLNHLLGYISELLQRIELLMKKNILKYI